MNLHRFSGGLKLEESQLEAPASPLYQMPVATLLTYPLRCRDGTYRKPVCDIGETVRRGQPLTACSELQAPVIASADGVVSTIEDTISITPTIRDDGQTSESAQPSEVKPEGVSLAEKIFQAGIEGHGGAAFCAATKIRQLRSEKPEYLIINACECEPLISCDRALIQQHSTELAQGIVNLTTTTGAKTCLIAVESERRSEIELLTTAIDLHSLPNVHVVSIPTLYPTGSERQLITVLTGKKLPPGERPVDHDILCFNIATVLAIKATTSDGRIPVQRIVSVTGSAIQQPKNVEVHFGTHLIDLIGFVEPTLVDVDSSLYELVIGGKMTGRVIHDWHTPVTTATNCVQVNKPALKPQIQACIRCGDCNSVCPENLIPQQLHWYCDTNDIESADKFGLTACIECGCCDAVCPSGIPLTQTFRTSKHNLEEQRRKTALAERAQQRSNRRDERLKRKDQLRQQRIKARKAEIEKQTNEKGATDAIQAALARAKAKKRS